MDLNRHGGKTIQERTEYRKLLKEKNLEAIRNKYQQDESQLTFKPEINYKSKNIKRSLNDLLVTQIFKFLFIFLKKFKYFNDLTYILAAC